jgi:hypothetical protein
MIALLPAIKGGDAGVLGNITADELVGLGSEGRTIGNVRTSNSGHRANCTIAVEGSRARGVVAGDRVARTREGGVSGRVIRVRSGHSVRRDVGC